MTRFVNEPSVFVAHLGCNQEGGQILSVLGVCVCVCDREKDREREGQQRKMDERQMQMLETSLFAMT